MCQPHIKGGQEKEDHSQQIPTFRCSKLPNLEICKYNDASQTSALKWERVYI